jgi:glycosyltransferase involved in cell wall biosynthesis
MYNKKKISLVMPCHNEERGLKEIFAKIPKCIDEVIIVDNNSSDDTAAIAKRHNAKVFFLEKLGYGLAYQAGLSEVTGDLIVMMDADNTYPTSEIKNFITAIIEKNYDFLTGCRFPLRNKNAMPRYKQISNYFISWMIRKYFKIDLVDSQSGMFVFKKELLPEIMSVNPGMGFSQEIKIKAWLNPSIRCKELHISYQKRVGKVKFQAIKEGLKNLYDVLLLKQKMQLVN